MKKIALVVLATFAAASFAFAAPQSGTVVSVDGDKVTIEVKGNKFKAGDAVSVDAEKAKKINETDEKNNEHTVTFTVY